MSVRVSTRVSRNTRVSMPLWLYALGAFLVLGAIVEAAIIVLAILAGLAVLGGVALLIAAAMPGQRVRIGRPVAPVIEGDSAVAEPAPDLAARARAAADASR